MISFFFWRSIFTSGPSVISGRTFDEFVSYLLLSTYLQTMMGYPLIYFISRELRTGGISHSLLRPIGYDVQMIYKTLGTSLVCALLFIPLLLCVLFMNRSIGCIGVLKFLILATLGIISYVHFDFILGLFTFWTENSWGIALFKQGVILFFSGRLFPVDMLGESLLHRIQYSPFPGMVYGPIEQLLGSSDDFAMKMMIQILWILLFKLCIYFLIKKAQKDVMIYGG